MKLASSYGHERDHDEDQVQDKDLGGMAKEKCSYCGRGPSVIADRLISIENELVSIHKLLEKNQECVLNVFLLQLGPTGRGSGRHCNLTMLRRPKVISIAMTFKLVNRNLCGLLSISVLFTFVNFDLVNALDGSPLSHPDHVDDGPSSLLPDQVDDASCKTLHLIDPTHVYNDDGSSNPLPDQVDDASCKTLPGEVADSVIDSEDRSPDERITDVLAKIHDEDDIEEFGDAAQNGYETANEVV
ncbi:hypothetical protein K7X08_026725 [Anisodus acutangulus]|uniref:Uncharacterized protein n=1 Tax=Anisodus acutangulus TaxID=402998 RepID=A0A9Q1LBF9_9SOLA|nr:hypothetical protein K7X08_026725 [Anisodus acutangulus]